MAESLNGRFKLNSSELYALRKSHVIGAREFCAGTHPYLCTSDPTTAPGRESHDMDRVSRDISAVRVKWDPFAIDS